MAPDHLLIYHSSFLILEFHCCWFSLLLVLTAAGSHCCWFSLLLVLTLAVCLHHCCSVSLLLGLLAIAVCPHHCCSCPHYFSSSLLLFVLAGAVRSHHILSDFHSASLTRLISCLNRPILLGVPGLQPSCNEQPRTSREVDQDGQDRSKDSTTVRGREAATAGESKPNVYLSE